MFANVSQDMLEEVVKFWPCLFKAEVEKACRGKYIIIIQEDANLQNTVDYRNLTGWRLEVRTETGVFS